MSSKLSLSDLDNVVAGQYTPASGMGVGRLATTDKKSGGVKGYIDRDRSRRAVSVKVVSLGKNSKGYSFSLDELRLSELGLDAIEVGDVVSVHQESTTPLPGRLALSGYVFFPLNILALVDLSNDAFIRKDDGDVKSSIQKDQEELKKQAEKTSKKIEKDEKKADKKGEDKSEEKKEPSTAAQVATQVAAETGQTAIATTTTVTKAIAGPTGEVVTQTSETVSASAKDPGSKEPKNVKGGADKESTKS